MVTLSIYTYLFEDAFDSVMDRLDTDHRELVRPNSGPDVVELSQQSREQSTDQGVQTPGGVSERSKETVLKTVGPNWVSWVRIPPPPRIALRSQAVSHIRYRVRGPVLRRSAPTNDLERWPSGRRRSPAKRVRGYKPLRGFKSLPLRQSGHIVVASATDPIR